jgi:hypothetical protein
MKHLCALLLILCALPAHAVTYKWIDKKGTTNFTEDLGNVPPEYRKKVIIMDSETPSGPEVLEIDESKKQPKEKGGDTKDSAAAVEADKKGTLYGGKDEKTWRREFVRLKADLRAAEEQAEQLRGRMADTSKMSRSEYLTLQASVKNVEIRVQDLKTKLGALDESANNAGVPPGARE